MARQESIDDQFDIQVASQEEYDRNGGVVSLKAFLQSGEETQIGFGGGIQFGSTKHYGFHLCPNMTCPSMTCPSMTCLSKTGV